MSKAVIDSVAVNHLLRTPKRKKRRIVPHLIPLAEFMRADTLTFMVDPDRGIIDEWSNTASPEAVAQLVIQWEALGGLRVVRKLGKLDAADSKKLRLMGFDDTIDKLILKVALATDDKIIVSEDGDFWDPKKPGRASVGKNDAPVCKFLHRVMGVDVNTLVGFVNHIRKLAQS